MNSNMFELNELADEDLKKRNALHFGQGQQTEQSLVEFLEGLVVVNGYSKRCSSVIRLNA